MNADEEKQGVRVSDIFYYIIKGRRLVAISALVGLILGVILSGVNYIRGEMSKEYRIDSSIAIVSLAKNGTFSALHSNPSLEDMQLAQDMTETAIYVINSELTINKALEKTGLTGISATSVKSNLTLTQYNKTQIVEMSLYWRSDSEGTRILEAINSVASDVLIDTLKVGQISVIQEPTSTYIIGGSISMSTWVMAAFVGFAIGAILCVLKLLIMPTFTNKKDLDYVYGLEVLGTVVQERNLRTDIPFVENGTQIKKDIASLVYILANRMERSSRKRLYLTSTNHGEGRTRLAANVAEQLAFNCKKTLLVDCDFKNPQLSALFSDRFTYEHTLNALYKGEADAIDAVTHLDGCLYLLPSVLEDEPLILSDALLRLIDEAAAGFDYVVIDAAPVGLDAGVINLNKITDTAIFVLRYDQEELKEIEGATIRLRESGIPSIGCIINGMKTVRDVVRDAQRLTLFRRKPKKEKGAKGKKKKTTQA